MTTCANRIYTFPHTYTEGDTLPEVAGTFTGLDLTGYTLEFDLVKPDGTVVQKSTATSGMTITDAAAGQFAIDWQETDLVTGKNQIGQVRFITPAGKRQTSLDILFNVKDRKRP